VRFEGMTRLGIMVELMPEVRWFVFIALSDHEAGRCKVQMNQKLHSTFSRAQ
jgi:hypothetical protein